MRLRCDCDTPVDRLVVGRCSGDACACGVNMLDDVGNFFARAAIENMLSS